MTAPGWGRGRTTTTAGTVTRAGLRTWTTTTGFWTGGRLYIGTGAAGALAQPGYTGTVRRRTAGIRRTAVIPLFQRNSLPDIILYTLIVIQGIYRPLTFEPCLATLARGRVDISKTIKLLCRGNTIVLSSSVSSYLYPLGLSQVLSIIYSSTLFMYSCI